MEEDKATANTAVAPALQQAPKPVMDVMPPPAAKTEQATAPTEPPQAPADAAEPVKEKPAEKAAEAPKDAEKKATPEQKKSDKPKKVRTAPVGVIVAALIIFVALSVLAYYAYSKG